MYRTIAVQFFTFLFIITKHISGIHTYFYKLTEIKTFIAIKNIVTYLPQTTERPRRVARGYRLFSTNSVKADWQGLCVLFCWPG